MIPLLHTRLLSEYRRLFRAHCLELVRYLRAGIVPHELVNDAAEMAALRMVPVEMIGGGDA